MIADEKTRKLIEDITNKIVKEYNPKKIILFRSYAYGEPTADSDIDLLIIKNTDETSMQRWIRLRRLLMTPDVMISITPFVYTEEELDERRKIRDFFIEEILKKGVVLYRRDSPCGCPT
jgi:predicted nucleotidyltransferase